MTRFVFLGLGFFGVMGWAIPAVAQTTVKFQQGTNGYQGCMDTYIDKFDSLGGNDFFGGTDRIEIRQWDNGAGVVEKMNILIKFDVSSIPTNATVTSATLTLYNTRARGQNGDVPVLEKVTSAWNNQSTWNMGVPSVVASGVTCPPVTNPPYVDDPTEPFPASDAYIITGMEALVQGWMTSSQTNYGIMLSVTSNLNFRFASSEYPLGAASSPYRPELSVTYTTPTSTTPPTVTVTAPPSTASSSPITVSGTASATSPATLTQITWTNGLTGATGTATGTTSWTAAIPLGRGNNTITITATDSNGGTGTTSFTVDYTPPPKTGKKSKGFCGTGVAGGSPGSFAGTALGLALLLVATSRRRV